VSQAYQTEKSLCGLFFTQAEKYAGDVFMRAKLDNGLPVDYWVGLTWTAAATQGAGGIRGSALAPCLDRGCRGNLKSGRVRIAATQPGVKK